MAWTKRRTMGAAIAAVGLYGVKGEANAIVGIGLRLLFSLGLRGALRGALRAGPAAGSVAGAAVRGGAAAAARVFTVPRATAAALSTRQAITTPIRARSVLARAKRLPTKHKVAGAGAGATATVHPQVASAGGPPSGAVRAAARTNFSDVVDLIDLALLGRDLVQIVEGGAPIDAAPVPQGARLEAVEVEIAGQNVSGDTINGILSIAIWDQAFHEGREGLFARQVMPVFLAARTGAVLECTQQITIDPDSMKGRWYIAPTLTRLQDGIEMEVPGFVFHPPIQALIVS